MAQMHRMTNEEVEMLKEMKERLGPLLTDRPQYPEVTGDRKLLRFLRGHDHVVDKATEMMKGFLLWRKDNEVDQIRDNIVNNGLDHPLRFPNGEKILSLIPQLCIAPDALDIFDSPICVDQYNFSPATVLQQITIQQYIVFTIHCLEYKSIIVEQISEEREKEILKSLPEEEDKHLVKVLVNTCVIRDLGGIGFEHVGSQGQEIIKAVMKVASDNYPELMRKCFMIKSPWLFNTLWYFIKGLMAARTIAKVSVMGHTYMEEINREISIDNLPAMAGGKYVGATEYFSYPFNKEYLNPPLSDDSSISISGSGNGNADESVSASLASISISAEAPVSAPSASTTVPITEKSVEVVENNSDIKPPAPPSEA